MLAEEALQVARDHSLLDLRHPVNTNSEQHCTVSDNSATAGAMKEDVYLPHAGSSTFEYRGFALIYSR